MHPVVLFGAIADLILTDETTDPVSGAVAAVVIVTGCVLLLAFFLWLAKRRARAWRAYAEQHGLTYRAEDLGTRNRLLEFSCTARSRERRLTNVISVEAQGVAMLIGDFTYYVGDYGSSKTGGSYRAQTVCFVPDVGATVPDFLIKSRSVGRFDRLRMESFTPVVLDDAQAFEKAYVVQGESAAVRDLFSPELQRFWVEEIDGPVVAETHGGALLVHRGKSIKPGHAEELTRLAASVVLALRT